MKNIFLQRLFFVLIFLFFLPYTHTGAQKIYRKMEVSLSGGLTFARTELPNTDFDFGGLLGYNFYPIYPISIGVEVNYGFLKQDVHQRDVTGRFFKNNYRMVNFNAKIFVFRWVQLQQENIFGLLLNNLHTGFGVGFIQNNISDIKRPNDFDNNNIRRILSGVDKSTDLLFSFSSGIYVPILQIRDNASLNLKMAINYFFTLGEGLDGYNSAWIANLVRDDIVNDYFFISHIGFSYSFGNIGYIFRKKR